MTSTDMADEIDRTIALAVAELRRYGGTEAQAEALREQFRVIAEDEQNQPTDKRIPD